MKASRPQWSGTVFCIASGPSLTADDVEKAKGHPAIVTNSTFRMAPWADVLFGFDLKWWQAHIEEVKATFHGRLMCMSNLAPKYGIETLYGSSWFRGYGNSGTCAISLALASGAGRVVLLGFDCCVGESGQKHWHGDHPKGFSNCASMRTWPKQFERVAKEARKLGVEVVNASRRTALTCFDRVSLESVH